MRRRGSGANAEDDGDSEENQETEREESNHTRKMGDLSQELDRLNDKIEEAEEIARNISGSWDVINKEFERYCKIRDRNGEI